MIAPQADKWIEQIRKYCQSLNISTDDLYQILTDLKVSPMIRGKAFEFSTYCRLQNILPTEVWSVTKPNMNAQSGLHDIDIMVTHKPTGKKISVECKLAGKGRFKVARIAQAGVAEKGDYLIDIKCMRSRTTKTPEKVESIARRLGIASEMVAIHSDQYRPSNFDVVATSIGNAFYQTVEDEEGNSVYKFEPTKQGRDFIKRFNPSSTEEAFLQELVYNKVYLAISSNITVSAETKIVCKRRKCTDKQCCGFIPNYPVINFGKVDELPRGAVPYPKNHWVEIDKAQLLFGQFVSRS